MYRDDDRDSGSVRLPRIAKVGIALVGTLIAIILGTMWAFETNLSGYTSICQMPISGKMKVITDPGLYAQWGGTITLYKQACTISFGSVEGENISHDSKVMPPIDIQFNDNGTASCSGNVRYELPMNEQQMLVIQSKYRSYEHLVEALLAKHTANVVCLTSQMFSSEETYSGARAEMQRLAWDQIQHGVYQTDVREIESEDPVTHEKRRARKVSIRLDSNGQPLRIDNPLEEFGIKCPQFMLSKNFQYEKGVLNQIEAQREAYMKTVTSRAIAQQATQNTITTKAEGEAAVMKAEYERLVIQKATVVEAETKKKVAETIAEQQKAVAQIEKERAEIQAKQELVVAELGKQAAEQTKQTQILLGEGEAARKKAVMLADGALELKLRTLSEINANYANAIRDYKGNWVPAVNMGGNTSSSGVTAASDLINMLMIKTAKDLAVDMGVQGSQFSPAINTNK